jgi:flagellar hook-associated protein 1 FlgK
MSILSTAYSGLNAFQRALDVTGNNISNSTTKGYSRQSIQFTASPTQKFAGSYVGTGVNVAAITRNVDQFASYQVRNTQTAKSEYEAFYTQASQIDKLLSQEGTSLSSSLQSFFNALGQLNNAPDSTASRNVALRQSQVLSNNFTFLQGQLDEYQTNSTNQINQAAKQINQITKDIASVNGQLIAASNDPSLLDQRDNLLNQLSEFVDVNVFDQGNNAINISLASGEMLVTGTEQRDLTVSSNLSDNFGTKIFLGSGSFQMDITDKVSSGMLGGLLSYEQDVLGKSSQMIGQMAIGLAQQFNAQHKLGMDMNNSIGRDFFTDYNSVSQKQGRSISASGNTGTAVLSVDISDISNTQLSDYELRVTDVSGNAFQLIRKSDGTSIPLTASGTIPATFSASTGTEIDGLTITVDNIANLADGDQFTLTPTRGAARDLAVQISDISQIALASPVKTSASLNNTGTGQIALGSVVNTTGVNAEYRIDILPPDPLDLTDPTKPRYTITNITAGTPASASVAFDPNINNTIQIPDDSSPSYSVVLSGAANTGDQFTLDYNTGGVGDNRNGLSLLSLQQSKDFTGGTESLFDRYANLLADVGSQTNQSKLQASSADVLNRQAIDFQDSKSGVNLDEEAANLLKYKQAYEAAGKLMQISSQMMSVIFDMMR